ncbi:sigma-70 family RNA polymerase sigma factor [Sorangium sp. So ce887]|uniref:sigma-70 family RNA polymerase sigma factor n=1 Tax=Sorangium sp. So ce887 TaxID=3133324 RepID=UPI003F5FD76E
MDAKDPRGASAGAPPPTWETLLREHLGFLRGCVASERIPEADREDVLQEVLHSISRALATFDPARGELRAWLKAVVHNHASNYRRRVYRRREAPWPDEPLEVADEAPSSEERQMEHERRQLLSTLLLELPPERREALIAHELGEAGIPRVAELLSIPATTAKSRVRHGREELKAAARRWQARHRRRLAALLPMRAAGGAGERPRRAAWRERLAHRVRRALREAVSGARAPRAGAAAQACGSFAASVWSVALTAGLLLAGHGGFHPGSAAPPGALLAARAYVSSEAAKVAQAGEPSVFPANDGSPANDRPPSAGAQVALALNDKDIVSARPRDVSRPQPRWTGAQGDRQEILRMAAAARAIGDDVLARALLERPRLDLSSITPRPDRNVPLAASTPAARNR